MVSNQAKSKRDIQNNGWKVTRGHPTPLLLFLCAYVAILRFTNTLRKKISTGPYIKDDKTFWLLGKCS